MEEHGPDVKDCVCAYVEVAQEAARAYLWGAEAARELHDRVLPWLMAHPEALAKALLDATPADLFGVALGAHLMGRKTIKQAPPSTSNRIAEILSSN